MTAPLSQDLRGRIKRLVEQGSSVRAAAERFEVSPSAAIKLMQRVRATGSTAPAKMVVIADRSWSLMRKRCGQSRRAGLGSRSRRCARRCTTSGSR